LADFGNPPNPPKLVPAKISTLVRWLHIFLNYLQKKKGQLAIRRKLSKMFVKFEVYWYMLVY